MVDIPGSVIIKSILKPGVVFYFPEESYRSKKSHFYVVLNINPNSDELLLMVCASSKIVERESARSESKIPVETLVFAGPEDCKFLKKKSVFDCNSPLVRSVTELIKKYNEGNLKIVKETIPNSIMEKLRNGIIKSPLLTNYHRNFVKKSN